METVHHRALKVVFVKFVQIRSFFWPVFSRIRTEYREILPIRTEFGEILRISPYSVRMRENTDRKKLRIWTLLTQCLLIKNEVLVHQIHNSLNSINPEFMQSYIKVKHVTINIRNTPMSKLPKTNSDSMDYLHKFRRIFIMEQNILVH